MFHLTVATPEGIIFEGEVRTVKAPGSEGYFQVLTNHAAMIAMLQAGKLTVVDHDGVRHRWMISEGFLEVSKNRASLITDSVSKNDINQKDKRAH